MKHVIASIIIFSCFFTTFSQSITAKLVDAKSGSPIQYASIKTGQYSGVISNEEGYFTINNDNHNLKSVIISCMGYQNKTLNLQDLKSQNFIIKLEEAINQLNEVFISNKKLNADDIIAKVKLNIANNYDSNLNKYSIFHRNTDYVDFKSLDFEIEKASHVSSKNINEANAALNALSKNVRESDMVHFKDFKGELYNLNADSSKLEVSKATKLLDYKNNFSIDDIQEKTQTIVLKYLDTTKTYKLKSGLFKIEDSLSLQDEQFKEFEKKEYKMPYLNKESRALLRKAQFYDDSFLNQILDSNLYEYTFEETAFNNGNLTYIISYQPRKSKAKYTGKLFISEDTYALTRIDYAYYKDRHGEKLNLKLVLGIKFIANMSEGTLLFEKNSNNKYHPKYLKQTIGAYFYVNRDLKFIENSRARNKTSISFIIEGQNRNKEELLFTSNNKVTLDDFNAIKQPKVVPYILLNQFENTIWENEEILEPLQEMKNFSGNKN